MAPLRLALLGTFEARLDSGSAVGIPRKKAEALLAYLALNPGQAQARGKLAALLWGDVSDARARHSLRQALVTLRKALPRAAAAGLVEEGDTVAVNPAAVDVDVALFQRLAAEDTSEALERAARLYRGDLLEGIGLQEPPFEEWLRTERERLRELAVETLAKLLAHQTRTGAIERAVDTAVRLLGLDPVQEVVHRTLMRLYARQGRRGAALRQYQVCVAVLERELGVEPEAETRELYRQLLQTGPPVAPAVVARQGVVPYVASATALVGRTTELATLRRQVADAWLGRFTVGVVQGEAGIGKTRLMEALVAWAVDEGRHVLVGRAHENEQVLPLAPWVDAFRVGQVVPGLVEGLEATWRAELARLFPELGPPEREPAAGEDYVRLFEAIARTLQHLASARPLLFVLEDLHWADEMSLRLLVFLGRRIHDAPVAIVGTLRLEEMIDALALRRTITQLGRQPEFFTVTLAPLSQAETTTLVRTVMRATTDEARVQRLGQRIFQASEGNAFMVLETVRALQGGVAVELEGEVVTPPRVRELIGGRLDRLSDRGRRLAAVASVIGREFDFALLERAAELSATETAEGVDELVARRVLHVVGERLDFTHERIREVCYDGLLPPYRRRLHQATAGALEGLHAADLTPHALPLGRHYYAAEAWDHAADYLAQAGRSAAARAAHREAIACFEQALEALGRLPGRRETVEQTIDLRFDVRQSCVPLRDHTRALEHSRRAESEAGSIGDRRRLGWSLAFCAHAFFLSGDSPRAIEAGRRSLAVAETLADPVLAESANFYLGQVFHWVGDYVEGARLLRENVTALEPELARRGLASKQFVNSRAFLGWCLAELGEFPEATVHTGEALATATAADNAYWLVHACFGAGLVHLRRGAFEEALAVAEQAVDLCRGRDFAVLWGISASILGLAYARTGRLAEGIALLARVVDSLSVFGAPVLEFLGEAQLLASRLEEASASAHRALQLAGERGEKGWEAWSVCLLGDIAASRDPADRAAVEDAYRRASALAGELGMRPLVARCQLGLGRLYGKTGKRPQAIEHVTVASTMFRDMHMAWWLAHAERERQLLA